MLEWRALGGDVIAVRDRETGGEVFVRLDPGSPDTVVNLTPSDEWQTMAGAPGDTLAMVVGTAAHHVRLAVRIEKPPLGEFETGKTEPEGTSGPGWPD